MCGRTLAGLIRSAMMKSHTSVAFAMLHRKVAVADRVQFVMVGADVNAYLLPAANMYMLCMFAVVFSIPTSKFPKI